MVSRAYILGLVPFWCHLYLPQSDSQGQRKTFPLPARPVRSFRRSECWVSVCSCDGWLPRVLVAFAFRGRRRCPVSGGGACASGRARRWAAEAGRKPGLPQQPRRPPDAGALTEPLQHPSSSEELGPGTSVSPAQTASSSAQRGPRRPYRLIVRFCSVSFAPHLPRPTTQHPSPRLNTSSTQVSPGSDRAATREIGIPGPGWAQNDPKELPMNFRTFCCSA